MSNPDDDFKLSEEEVIVLYKLFHTLQKYDFSIGDLVGDDHNDMTAWNLMQRVKKFLNSKGSEYLRHKKVTWWW